MKNRHYRLSLVMLLIIAMVGTLVLSACGKKEEELPPAPPHNALTGEQEEDGYDKSASDRRIAAFVVENSVDARPQWGLDDENYSPDMVVQGEVEGGITRTLWLYADYEKLPEIIGPTRSARPPFIRFSELFDSIFIHWGMSHSKGDYVGATTVFKQDNVDHINQMTLDDQEGLFGRDQTRSTAIEHRGIIYGDKVAATIENEGFRTNPKDYTEFLFNEEAAPAGEKSAANVSVTYSEQADEPTVWTYDESDGKYHTKSFENDFVRDNLLVLYDDTEYITKDDYQGGGMGSSVTYCDYKLAGGKGQLFMQGTVKDIEWVVEDGKLILKDPSVDIEAAKKDKESTAVIITPEPEDGESEEDAEARAYAVQPLNKGKIWVGWISRNNGGSVSAN